LRVSSNWRSAFARTRSTSAAAIGFARTPSTVPMSASRAAASESVSGTCAQKMMLPGSDSTKFHASTALAFFASTSARYSRPAGSTVITSPSASNATASGCAPGTVW
jgi:hypothetical protein